MTSCFFALIDYTHKTSDQQGNPSPTKHSSSSTRIFREGSSLHYVCILENVANISLTNAHMGLCYHRKHCYMLLPILPLPHPVLIVGPACNGLVSCPPHTRLPVRNGLVNEVEFLGLFPQDGGRPMRLQER